MIDLDSPIVTAFQMAFLEAMHAGDVAAGRRPQLHSASREAVRDGLNAALAEFRKQQGIPTSILNIGGKA